MSRPRTTCGGGGAGNFQWKGENAGYSAIHKWMQYQYPRVGRCEWCGCTDKPTEYASASHDRYTRNRADWFEFCKPCHAAFDGVAQKMTTDNPMNNPVYRQKISAAMSGRTLSHEHRDKISNALMKTHCKRAHPLSGDNLYVDPAGRRVCKTCKRARLRRWREQQSAPR